MDFSLIPRPNKHKGGSGYMTKWTCALSVIMNFGCWQFGGYKGFFYIFTQVEFHI